MRTLQTVYPWVCPSDSLDLVIGTDSDAKDVNPRRNSV
jgi:hypothetical protein